LAGKLPRRTMGLVAATATGLVIWVILWAIGLKAFDAFLIVLLIVLVTAVGRSLTTYLPGRRS
jgi:hypothetical protein